MFFICLGFTVSDVIFWLFQSLTEFIFIYKELSNEKKDLKKFFKNFKNNNRKRQKSTK